MTDCPYRDIHTKIVHIVAGIPADALVNMLRYPKPIAISIAHQMGKVSIQEILMTQNIDWLKENYSEGAD